MDKKEIIGKRIRDLRKAKGYKQSYLAEKLCIENRQLSKLENGHNYPSFETIERLLEVFQIDFKEFIEADYLKPEKNLIKEINILLNNAEAQEVQKLYKIAKIVLNK